MSLRDTILAVQDERLKLRPIEVPEWGVTVYVKGWSGKDREALEALFPDGPEKATNYRGMVLCRYLFDEAGARIFTDTDADALGDQHGETTRKIFRQIMELSGLTVADLEDAKKNSPPDPSDAST